LRDELAELARFEILGPLGAGGVGLVYEARNRESGELVAIKTLHDVTPDSLYRLKREFRMLQGLEHPNLCQHYELFEHAGRWFIAMERVHGVELHAHVGVGERCDEAKLRAALVQLAAGLSALHDAGLVHRDVKPSNVMVTPSGRVVLLDFGFVEDTAPQQRSHTIVGTPIYMAPEQALASEIGPPADWFSVGVILFEALTGQLPHDGDTPLALLMNKQTVVPPRVSSLAPHVPPDLDVLCADLLSADPTARPHGRTIQRKLGGIGDDSRPSLVLGGAFVGRSEELALLQAAFDDVAQEKPVSVLAFGRSGVGKTALVHRFAEHVIEQGALVLAGRCFERESVPYKAFDTAIDALAKHLRGLPDDDVRELVPRHADLLIRMFPVLGAVRALSAAPPTRATMEPHEQRNQAFGALRELLYRLASSRPVVITIDDWHWADADSVVLLRDLVRHRDSPPMLIVLTSRPRIEDIPGGDVRHIEVTALVESHAIELARQTRELLAPNLDLDLAEIVRETGGHPLYITELVRYLAAHRDHSAVRLDEAILARIDGLSVEARSIVEALAVAGEPLTIDLLRDIVELAPTIVQRQSATLRLAHLIRSGQGDGTLEPYHDRVRESVLDAMPENKRVAWHRQIAFALETSKVGRERPELLLRHLDAAGESGRTAELAVNAAQRAAIAGAFDRAASLYALALRTNRFDDARARTFRIELGQALANAGRGHESAEAYLAAAEGADTVTRMKCRREAAEQLIMIGESVRGLDILRTLLREVDVTMPMTPRRALLSLVWARAKLRARGLDWKERRASQIPAETLIRLDVVKVASHSLALIDNIRAADFNARWLLHALRVGERTRCAFALATEVMFQGSQGGPGIKRARAILDTVRKLEAEASEPRLRAFVPMAEGVLAYWACRLDLADEMLGKAERMFREETVGTSLELKTARQFHMFTMRHRGTWSKLRIAHEQYNADAERRGDRYVLTSMNRFCSMLRLAEDKPDEAARMVADATWEPPTSAFHTQHWYELEARGEIAMYQGSVDLPALEPLFDGLRRSVLLRVVTAKAVALWLRGRLTLSAGGPDAPKKVTQIIRQLEKVDDPRARVGTALLGAALATVSKDYGTAVGKLRVAEELALGHSMHLYAAAARRQRGSLVGASEGAMLRANADTAMHAEGIVNPSRFADWYVPGIRL
jgi:serine/threonine protein kinase